MNPVVKCILSFREDETKVKNQMFGIFLRKADVYIRQLQVRMRISAWGGGGGGATL